MVKGSEIIQLLLRPSELRAVIQWKVWHDPVHERNTKNDSESLKKCFYYLDFTSRSFSAVIKELHPELLVPVCLFYLVLRGMDTIEDDTTIPIETKEPILRSFDEKLETDGWTFEGNNSREKDRALLVEFDCVITEFRKIKPAYRVIVKDITKRMGNGMADYCNNVDHVEKGVKSVDDYVQYCHHVAGLVGEGLTRLFIEAKLANPALLEKPELMESMGQLLQQVNIIRDIKEDWDEKRRFWPQEIWSKYVKNFEDLLNPEYEKAALDCNSEMIYTALTRAEDCLYYLAGIREQSVFNFCAIPQTMAMATLDLCYRNPEMFKRNIKIRKGQACENMMESSGNLRMVCAVFRKYVRSIHQKSSIDDPNFLNISIVCGRIEQFIETIFPSQQSGGHPTGSKSQQQLAKEKRDSQGEGYEVLFVALASVSAMVVATGSMVLIAWLFGARFDLMWEDLKRQGAEFANGGRKPLPSVLHNEL